ncbi:MAG: copper resistance CopC family protein [Nocardioides sp.]
MVSRWLVVAVLVWLTVGVGSAAADTVLVESKPSDGSTVKVRPETVTLDFVNRILPPAEVVIVGPDGRRVDDGEAAVLDTRVQQPFNSAANGSYSVVYRVVGDDQHAIQGRLTFTVDAPVVDAGGSWIGRNGAQLIGALVIVGVIGGAAALRLRPAPSAPPADPTPDLTPDPRIGG